MSGVGGGWLASLMRDARVRETGLERAKMGSSGSDFPVRPRQAPLGSQQPEGGGEGTALRAGTSGWVSGSPLLCLANSLERRRLTAPGTRALMRQGERKNGSFIFVFSLGLGWRKNSSAPDSQRATGQNLPDAPLFPLVLDRAFSKPKTKIGPG